MSALVSAVIPAHNEVGRVGETVRALRRAGCAHEVIVVDDGSGDGTAQAAAAAGAVVLRLPCRRGKGEALAQGARLARGDLLLFLDADLGASAAEAWRLVEPVAEGRADMAVAVLPRPRRRGGLGLVVRLARGGIRRLTGLRLRAPLSGQRALRREVLAAVGAWPRDWGVEVGLTVGAARAGFRIVEVETAMTHAASGRDLRGWLHRGRQFLAVLRTLLRCGWRPWPTS